MQNIFIVLTQVKDGRESDLLLRADELGYGERFETLPLTQVTKENGRTFSVKETPRQIRELIREAITANYQAFSKTNG